MEIYPTIEALLHYANFHLLFDELDYVYARNRIMDLLNLTDYEEYEMNDEEIESFTCPNQILDALTAYAVIQKIIKEEEKELFKAKIMDCVLKRPSEIEQVFYSLPTQKAFDWLLDYSVKSGYVTPLIKKWEGKNTKGKIEASFIDSLEEQKQKKYPECNRCRDNEGYEKNITLRTIPLELYQERMFFNYLPYPIMQNQGLIISEYHRPLTLNITSLNKLFDFIDLMPNYVIAANETQHESYSVTSKLMPLNKAPDLFKFKSQDYPYININAIDWYFGAIRLSYTNREKLIEYTDILINKWKEMNEGNESAVSVRKSDSNYIVEIMFLSKNKGVDENYNNISNLTSVTSLMGSFCINKALDDKLKQIEKFLTKEEKFSLAKFPDLKPHEAMINRLIKNLGSGTVTQLEAQLDIKDEVMTTLEKALTSLNEPIEQLYKSF